MSMNNKFETKSAFVAIVGRPNVGKSSLLNALIGEKVAAVSAKPQTTRTRITGILTKGLTQFVFIDTPGLHKPKTKLADFMVKQVGDSVADVDIAILVVEPKGEITQPERDLIERFKALRLPAILCINKIDTLENKEEMLAKIAMLSKEYNFDEVIPISALKKDGINILTDELEKYAEEGPHYFADDSITDQPERAIVAELIRERMLIDLEDEVPHGIAVSIEAMKDREGEAIAWHLHEVLGLDKKDTKRIAFHEITKTAILDAIQHPRDIDYNMVNAQQARRLLDRIVGYEYHLSYGRK